MLNVQNFNGLFFESSLTLIIFINFLSYSKVFSESERNFSRHNAFTVYIFQLDREKVAGA